MKKLLTILAALAILASGTANAQVAERLTAHRLDRPWTFSSFVAPTGCVSTSVPFFGADLKLTCDGGITYDSTGRALTTETVKATSYAAQAKTVTITGATNATPIVVTATAHGLYTGDLISISGITGNTNANGFFEITRLTADTFSLQNYSTGADIAGNGAYGGTPVAVTGIVQANRVLVGDGTAAQPSIAAAAYPSTGIHWRAATAFDFSLNGASVYNVTNSTLAGFSMKFDIPISWTSGSSPDSGQDLYLSRGAAATLQLGAANAASPVAQTLQAQGGSGTDVAGANLTIRPGAGTGAATGSSLIFRTPTATGSGGGAQTQTTRLTINASGITMHSTVVPSSDIGADLGAAALRWSKMNLATATLGSRSKTLTDGSPVTFATFTIADGAMYSGEIIYNVKAVKGTDVQVLANKARFTAARVGTNYYVSVAAIGSDVASVSTGTLTCPITISGTGGVISLVATADTSFSSPDSLVGQFRFDSPDAALALSFP